MSISIIKKLAIAFSVTVFLFYFGLAAESASKDKDKKSYKTQKPEVSKKKNLIHFGI
jgi:hypothetical protein